MALVLAGTRARIDVPPPPVATGGFLAAARVIDLPEGSHELMGAEYVTDACTGPNNSWGGNWCVSPIAAQCTDPGTAPANPKLFDVGNEVVTGEPFVAYAGSACDIDSLEGRLRSATAAFNFGERRSVDYAMAAWLDAAALDTEVTGSIMCVIGQMEEWLAVNYGGRGLLAIPLAAVIPAAAEGSIYPDPNGDGLITALATPVAAYVTENITTTFTAFAMGQLTLLRGPLSTYTVPPMIRSDGTCEPARALAERVYVPLVECAVGQFSMTCCDCAGGTAP